MNRLKTEEAEDLYRSLRDRLREFLGEVDASIGIEESSLLDACRGLLKSREVDCSDSPDEMFDDFFVLHRYLDFFGSYGQLWRLIRRKEFSASWGVLQDAFDCLRLVRKFSNIDISAFEDQLAELEKTYPYKVFFSIGLQIDRFECSICGEDIDSSLCAHRKGQLYRGRLAVGIARGSGEINHVAMVEQPEDRRCVIKYEDTAEQFRLVLFLSDLLRSRKCAVSSFGRLRFSKRWRPNPEHRKVGRNDPCYCNSGLKFKRCCIDKSFVEGDHMEIVADPVALLDAVR